MKPAIENIFVDQPKKYLFIDSRKCSTNAKNNIYMFIYILSTDGIEALYEYHKTSHNCETIKKLNVNKNEFKKKEYTRYFKNILKTRFVSTKYYPNENKYTPRYYNNDMIDSKKYRADSSNNQSKDIVSNGPFSESQFENVRNIQMPDTGLGKKQILNNF